MLMMTELLSEMRANPSGDGQQLAALSKGVEALISAEAARPRENPQFPGKSALNPLGDHAHPRPELKCRMFWVGYKLSKEGLTHEEIELLNRVQPGEYRVTKSHGRSIPFTVAARLGTDGRLEQMTFHFPCKSTEDRHDHNSMTAYLREILGEATTVEVLRKQLAEAQVALAARS